jgi:septal ring factor EnvC (AmiA/AmiB activator)
MNQQIDSLAGPQDHVSLDKRLAVVESNYASKDYLRTLQSDMRGWFIVHTLSIAMFTGGFFIYTVNRMDSMDHRIDQIELRVERIDGRLVALEVRMSALEDRMKAIEERLNAMESQLKEIRDYMIANPRR